MRREEGQRVLGEVWGQGLGNPTRGWGLEEVLWDLEEALQTLDNVTK